MDSVSSEKISFISLLTMMCVVAWHCHCGSAIERWVIPLLFTWSVPWFFFVSGVFLAKSVEHRTIGRLYASKLKSLVVPYFLWCVIGAMVTGIAKCGSFCDVFALTRGLMHPTGNWALWYLCALILFVFAAVPLLYLTKKHRFLRGGAIVLFCVLAVYANRFLFSLSTGSAPFYFAAGMALSRLVLSERNLPLRRHLFFAVSGLLVFIAFKSVYFALGYDFFRSGGSPWANISHIGIMVCLWFSLDVVGERLDRVSWIVSCSSMTAFVYFMHYPILRRVIEACPVDTKLLFFVSVVVAPCVFFAIAGCVRKLLSGSYRILSGGR